MGESCAGDLAALVDTRTLTRICSLVYTHTHTPTVLPAVSSPCRHVCACVWGHVFVKWWGPNVPIMIGISDSFEFLGGHLAGKLFFLTKLVEFII